MNIRMNQETDEAKWQAVVHKDSAADGTFYYSVKTTGVYCRPSCAATPAGAAQNVAFHATVAASRGGRLPRLQALHAQRDRRWPSSTPPPWRRPAAPSRPPRSCRRSTSWRRTAGMSRYHFHRVFKAVTGLTPKAYAAAHRARRVREELAQGEHRDRGDLRGRLQLEQPFLREVRRRSSA